MNNPENFILDGRDFLIPKEDGIHVKMPMAIVVLDSEESKRVYDYLGEYLSSVNEND